MTQARQTTVATQTPAALLRAIEDELAAVRVSLSRRIDALAELHVLFTSERSQVKRLAYLDVPRLRDAYLRYHLPLNVARVRCALRDVFAIRPEIADLSDVVDLGAGPGSASIATLGILPADAKRRYLVHDRSRATLQIARRLVSRVAVENAPDAADAWARDRLEVQVGSLPALPRFPRKSLVWLSMVLNEIGVGDRRGVSPERLLGNLARTVDPPSVVIIIEPALRAPSRNLLALHDVAVASTEWRVLAPCTHPAECPLLRERDRSWCHFRFRWSAPRVVREVADPLGLEWSTPSFSYLALLRLEDLPRSGSVAAESRGGASTAEVARVIGDRMRVQGGKDGLYICRDGRRETLRDPSPGIARGDVVRIATPKDVRILRTWDR